MIVKRIVVVVAAIYTLIVATLFFFQRSLMYWPDPRRHVPPSHYDILSGVQEVEIKTEDGVNLVAWFAPPPPGRPTVIIFHGNGGSLRGLRYRIAHFKDESMGALLLAYRGYSGSEGSPTEAGLYKDARAALNWLNLQSIADKDIVLYGESLGTGIATKMGEEREVALVVLESPYTSTADVAAERFPLIPTHWLMSDQYNSLARIKAIQEPLLIMHGRQDKVIPQEHGKALFAAANEPKEGFWPKDAGHGNIFDLGGFVTAKEFIERRYKP